MEVLCTITNENNDIITTCWSSIEAKLKHIREIKLKYWNFANKHPAQDRKDNISQCFLTLSSKRLAMVSPGHVCQHRMKVNWPTVDKKCCWQKQQEQRRRKQLNSCCLWPLELDNKVEYVDQIECVFIRIQYLLIQDFLTKIIHIKNLFNQILAQNIHSKFYSFKSFYQECSD